MSQKQKILDQYHKNIQESKNLVIEPIHKYDITSITAYFANGVIPDDLIKLLQEAYDKIIENIVFTENIPRGKDLGLFVHDYKYLIDYLNNKKWTEREDVLYMLRDIDLNRLRLINNLSQRELAKKLGSAQSTISDIENKRIPIPKSIIDKLPDLLKYLKYTPEESQLF